MPITHNGRNTGSQDLTTRTHNNRNTGAQTLAQISHNSRNTGSQQIFPGTEIKIYLAIQSDYGTGLGGYITFKRSSGGGIDASFTPQSFYNAYGPSDIKNNSPTCIGGYVQFHMTNALTDSSAWCDKMLEWAKSENILDNAISNEISINVEWRGTSNYYGGGGYVAQKFKFSFKKTSTKFDTATFTADMGGNGAASTPNPGQFYVNVSGS